MKLSLGKRTGTWQVNRGLKTKKQSSLLPVLSPVFSCLEVGGQIVQECAFPGKMVLEMGEAGVGEWKAQAGLILRFFCLCNNSIYCHHISTFCCKSQYPLTFVLLNAFLRFPKATWTVFLQVACLPQITKIAWVLESELSYSAIYYLVLLFLNLLIIHAVKEIPFGPFKTARLADLNTQPQLLLEISVLLLKWPF